ncbi:MAG: PIN domain-containing protein [Actinomycetota bacterium]
MIVADASVLIAYLDRSDPHHDEAIDVIAGVEHFVVHPLTLAEVLVHPVRLGREAEVMARLEAVGMMTTGITINSIELARIRVESGLKLPDCVVLLAARTLSLPVATFDTKLGAAAGGRGGT